MSRESKSTPRLRLRVTATAESIVRSGHPWLFAESVRDQNREGQTGELAVVFDRNDTFLAVGLFDAASPIRVRILHVGKPQMIDRDWWRARLDHAISKRDRLFGADTTGYRLINGESDGWPGLVLDRYGATLVMKLYTAAWFGRVEEIGALIQQRLNPERTVLRLSRNISTEAKRLGFEDGQTLAESSVTGSRESSVVFLENGIRFEADVLRGQKTGFFLDQRENRRDIEALARGRTVLNAFSFSGGFSLYAARGGATSVTDLDISAHALESAKRNFALNQAVVDITRCRHELIQTDAFEWLAGNVARKFELIVLDPPSLAKREVERAGAVRTYGTLAESGIAHLAPGGILVACSCSAHVSAEEFFNVVRTAARSSQRRFSELKTTLHAPDHPATFDEARYLKAIFLRLD